MSSIRDKMLASIQGRSGRSPSPSPLARAPRPEGPSDTPKARIPRMPSNDALNLSSHNAIEEDDGSEVSKDRIIASLKKANAALTSKTAEMEATFMNQLSSQTKLIEEREKENMVLKAKVTSHESQLKEGAKIISTLEEEKGFQKQTITDLKNQLFQLQNDIEDTEYDKSEELTAHKQKMMVAEKKVQTLEKEKNALVNQLDSISTERDRVKTELFNLMKHVKNKYGGDSSSPSIEISIHDSQLISETSVPSPTGTTASETSEVRQNWRQLEEKNEQLESTLTLLHETQSSLATLEHKHRGLQKQFDKSVEAQTEEVKKAAQQQIDELKSALRAKDETITNLHQRLENYNDDLTKAEDEIDRLNAEINDASLSSLKVELEETQNLLEKERELTFELTEKYDELTETVEKLEKETHSLRLNSVDEIIEEKEEKIKSLGEELSIFRNKLGEEKKQGEMLINIKASKIKELEDELKIARTDPERRISQLEEENKVLHDELESMEKELNNAIQAHNEMEEEMEKKIAEKDEALRSSRGADFGDFTDNFETSANSLGLVNDEVVARLRGDLSDIKQDRASLKHQLEVELASRDTKIVELQKEIDMQKQKISSIEDSHKMEISKLVNEIEVELTTVEEDHAIVKEKENEIQRLEKAVGKVNQLLDEKEEEIKSLKESSEKSHSVAKRDTSNEIQRLERAIKETNLLLDKKQKELKSLRESSKKCQSLVKKKDGEIQRLESVVEEVNLRLDQREKEAKEEIKLFLEEKEKEIGRIKDAAEEMKSFGEQHEEERKVMKNKEMGMISLLQERGAEIEKMKLSKHEMKALLEKRERKISQMEALLEKRVEQVDQLELEISKVKDGAEEKENEMRQDIEAREDAWKEEKRQLVEEKGEVSRKLDVALKAKEQLLEERNEAMGKLELLKEEASRKESVDHSMKSRESSWTKEKKQLLDEKDDLMTRLDSALQRLSSQKDQINELEFNLDDCEVRLEKYTKDLALLDELKDQLDDKQEELDSMKEQSLVDQKNHQRIIANLRGEGKKRGDKLKIMELNEELEKLKAELRKSRANKDDLADTVKQDTVKKAYTMAKDTQHRKDISDLENKLKKEVDELKSKLSDRDTTITATLRSSVLKDQKIKSLKDQIKALREGNDDIVDMLSLSSNKNPLEELQNLRESIHNHEETQRSLNSQIRSLKKQLADAKVKNSDKNHGRYTATMEKQLDEYKTKIRERDGAIQTLVKSSITQEQQISSLRDELADLKQTKTRRSEPQGSDRPSWKEIERLQQESEIFAGQIIEQDEEIEELRRLLEEAQHYSDHNESLRTMVQDLQKQLAEQLELNEERLNKRNMSHAMKIELEEELLVKDNENERSKRMLKTTLLELDEEKAKNDDLRMKFDEEKKNRINLESEIKRLGKVNRRDSKFTKINDELEEVEETNQKLQYEIRDLRRKLRSVRLEADRANDLELELSETKRMLSDLKWKRNGNHHDDDSKKLTEAIEQRDALETQTREMSKDIQKLKDDCQKADDECKKLEEELTMYRKERDGVVAEYLAKEKQRKEVEETLRQELQKTVKAREELEENESRLRSEIQLQKNRCSEKEAIASKAIQEAENQKAAISELQRDYDDQNDLIQSLTTEVKNLRSSNMNRMDTESTELIAALSDEIKKLRQENLSKQNHGESSDIIAALTDEVKKLRNNQAKSDPDVVKALTLEVQTLHAALQEQRGQSDVAEIERVVRGEIEQEIQSIRSQKDFLGNENMNLRSKLEALEEDRQKISMLKKQVDEAEKGRTLFEKTMISTYERKLNLMQMNKDLTIDGLRKELAQTREGLKDVESDLLDKVKSLEVEKNELEMELKAKMQHKNAKIQFMEQTLSAQEQLVNHMKDELDQLQNGMENVSVTRRAELEEMQEDLMSVQTKATRYEREITALKMKIEDQKVQHRNEISNLHYRMEEMEIENDESPTIRQQAEKDKMALHSLSRQVDSLKTKVGSLQEENFDLREKISKGGGDSRASKNDKWRNSALQEQVMALTKRLKELEGDDGSVRSSSSRRSLRSKNYESGSSSRRMPPTPRGMSSFNSRRSNHGSVGDDISTYTEETF